MRRSYDNSLRSIHRRPRLTFGRCGVRALQFVVVWFFTLGCGVVPVLAQDMIDSRLEYNVKAVSLYAFGRYVTWPEAAFVSADSPFVIGLMGGNPFGDALDRIAAKKTLNGRAIQVRQITAPEEAISCHILFVSRTVAKEAETELFTHVAGKPVLMVGESPGFAGRGGIINFYHSGSNVRFELNPDKGVESQLSLNAKLLTLGTKATTAR
jgi:YfiR/HmsC-like